jgi:spore coat polysaccharide biosynthesis predicted glycosyltransferase SpsG
MRVGFRCDAGALVGAGHVIRCVALAEELVGRGGEVEFLGSVDGPAWVRTLLDQRGISVRPAPGAPDELAAVAGDLGLDAVVLDSYVTDPACAERLLRAGVTVLAIVDGDPRGQRADLYLDQNLDAERAAVELPAGGVRLAGARFVLLRDSVRRLRPDRPRAARPGIPRLLCFFGGTDATDAAPAVLRWAAATGAPFDATVVAARPGTADALAAVHLEPGQSVTPIPPTDRLPALAAAADLVVTAAGTATWELLCLGAPTALIWVADNQRLGYEAAVGRGVAAGLGGITTPAANAVAVLRTLLTDPAARADLAARGHALIDGRGRERVAGALFDAVTRRSAAGARTTRTFRPPPGSSPSASSAPAPDADPGRPRSARPRPAEPAAPDRRPTPR